MKNKLLIALLLIVGTAYAQIPFFPQGAEWRYIQLVQVSTMSEQCKNYTQFKVEKDTIINCSIDQSNARTLGVNNPPVVKNFTSSKVTAKVFKNNVLLENLQSEFFYQEGKKVYFYSRLSAKFNLLFDFGASVGDTIKVFDNEAFYYPFELGKCEAKYFKYVIDSVKQTVIGSENLVRQVTTSLCPDYYTTSYNCNFQCWGLHLQINKTGVTEKIGAANNYSSFIGSPLGGAVVTAGNHGLIYYKDKSIQIEDQCNTTALESGFKEEKVEISFDETSIKLFKSPNFDKFDYQIIDVLGRTYFNLPFLEDNSQYTHISTQYLKSGVYFIRLHNNTSSHVYKFAK